MYSLRLAKAFTKTVKANFYKLTIIAEQTSTGVTFQAWKLNAPCKTSTEVEHNNNNNDKEKEKDRIDWRRSKVQELSSQDHSQREISQTLQVG